MPFQVIYSARRTVIPPVHLITAGENQTLICGAATVFLEASVDEPANLTGHTLEWEQLEGSPVILSTPNQLSTTYNWTENSDKIFRFWIDKGRPGEQYDDVRIYHTPTSFCSLTQDIEQHLFVPTLDPAPVACEDIIPFVDVSAPPPSIPEGEEPLGPVIDVTVSWSHPGDVQNDPFISQYSVVEDGIDVNWVPPTEPTDAGDGNGPPADPLTYIGQLAIYRIDTYYNISGRKFYRPSCEKDFTGLTIPTTLILNSAGAIPTTNEDHKTFDVVRFGFLVQNHEDPVTAMTSNVDHRTFDVVRFSFLVQNHEDPVTAMTSNVDHRTINITRYGGTGIGGG